MHMENKTEWFQHWFDTKYYHLLYDHRNKNEAEFFMQNLIDFLQLKKGASILDLPCGKGRHAIFLNKKGFKVKGADLSTNSIASAKHFENATLQFVVHDMREPLQGKYDVIFNLFTSFGYFEKDEVNVNVLKNFKSAILNNGKIVIDFLNIDKIKANLVAKELIHKNDIDFYITRKIENEILTKDIRFTVNHQKLHFTEKVQCLTLEKMHKLSEQAKLKIQHVFGDYSLSKFEKLSSDRLILILE